MVVHHFYERCTRITESSNCNYFSILQTAQRSPRMQATGITVAVATATAAAAAAAAAAWRSTNLLVT